MTYTSIFITFLNYSFYQIHGSGVIYSLIPSPGSANDHEGGLGAIASKFDQEFLGLFQRMLK